MSELIVSVSGVRGTVGEALTPQVACDFACAFAASLSRGATVVLARDTRPSGAAFSAAARAGLLASGVNVIDIGVVTTPGAALMTKTLNADGAVVITASHNPIEYNGMKFLQPDGPALTAEQANRLAQAWRDGGFRFADARSQGKARTDDSTHSRHVEAVCDLLDVGTVAEKRFRVVLDSINGAGCIVTPMLLDRLGCEVLHINSEPTGDFAHTPEPVEQNLSQLCGAVREHKADVGFAQDPDADRLVLVDEQGRFIGEEYTLALAAADVLARRKGDLATNLATSRMIDDIAADAGCRVLRSPTGEANVAELMAREGCIFGGEGNGGVMEPELARVRDSLVGIAYVLRRLAETGKTLSELVAEIPSYQFVKTKLPCPQGRAEQVVKAVREDFSDAPDARFNDADGLRIDLPVGWVSVRGSNTEPILRIFAEAGNEKIADELVQRVRQIAENVAAS
ncbi:MAG: phosphoglucosamine mutase [Planctomycetota bacterium]